MTYKIISVLLMICLSSSNTIKTNTGPKLVATNAPVTFESKVNSAYSELKNANFSIPNMESFSSALEGFYQLKEKGKIQKDILTIIDFTLSSTEKRMWVIDMATHKVLYHTLVAHGRNTGEEFAKQFSNKEESYQSSLGFYATAETYIGKHGFSLRLDGLEKGINDKARDRAIVIHGADYVSEKFVKQTGRLGRSQGCPALPVELTKEIINVIKDNSCLFIYYPSQKYTVQSKLVS
ncbi:MAG: murein L,D-transpeptidase catalytic domain family protein [Flavobacterium sp.]|nr:murein L,D-transpeptidase catalytic domain family protein [Flavobacterium sp.]